MGTDRQRRTPPAGSAAGKLAAAARRRQGSAAEALALRHLEEHGLRILARNFRTPLGEIDLVMLDGPVVVFVEVRSRRHARFMHPAESIDAAKQKRLVFAAMRFLKSHPRFASARCRFDAVLVCGSAGDPEIRWIRAAFEA